MAERRYDRNPGLMTLPTIPDDKYIVGAVVVLMDENGFYSAQAVTGSLDELPEPETQEMLGGYVATAFEIANTKAIR